MQAPKRKILIVEDNVDLQELYKVYFEIAGFEVYQRMEGLGGLTEIIELKPDIVLLDIMMPQMNGYEVLHVLRDQSSINIPIIVCSNLSQKSDIDKALDAGADAYIRKSDYDGKQIVDKVMEVMKEKHLI